MPSSPLSHAKHLTHPEYRPDIDGLRAVSVLFVIMFHAFPSWVPGGFVGVDIFFVISGFLISTIIIQNLEQGNFSFIEFYSRRIRRIFPALLLVLVASYSFGWFVLLASEYKQLGGHIAAGAGFISNFVLLTESGYFDNAAATKPLLHLWSVGVEEQFYILWPVLIWAAWKKNINLLKAMVAIACLSFGLNIVEANHNAVAAFYLPQTRFWELLTGAVLAQMILYRKKTSPEQFHAQKNNNIRSIFGVLLIGIGFFIITKDRVFLSLWAVIPTSGAVLLISAGQRAWLNRVVLSNPVLVWIGLCSFPLYLWHWPLLSFARIIEGEMPSQEVRFAAIILSVPLAWLTYIFIEKPIRFGRHAKTKAVVLCGFMLAVGLLGYVCYRQDGLEFRSAGDLEVKNEGDVGQDLFFEYSQQKFYACTPADIRKEAPTWKGLIRCFQSQENATKKVAIIGDSHAEHLFIGLAEQFTGTNIVYYLRHALPFIDEKEFEKVFQSVIADQNITTVILTAYWDQRLPLMPQGAALESELLKTVAALTGANKKVYIADDVPGFFFEATACKYVRKLRQKNLCVEDKQRFYGLRQRYYPIFQSIQQNNANVKTLEVTKYFCDADVCKMAMDGHLLYRDTDHLNINGSKYLGRKIIENNPHLFE